MDAHSGHRMVEGLRRLRQESAAPPAPAVNRTTFGGPDDAAIVAAYRKIHELDRPMLMREAEAIQIAPATLIGGALDLGLTIAVAVLLGATTIAFVLTFGAMVGFAVHSAFRHHDRIARGEAGEFTSLLAVGPFSSAAIGREFARWTEANHAPNLSIDTGSLSVIEPVARYLAAPILAEAHTLVALAPNQADAFAAARADGRRDELREQARRETDPIWRRAAEEQADRLDARARVLRDRHTAGLAARERILADARELRDYLDRLTERRRLLEEMGAERLPLSEGTESSAGDEVRARLGTLADSLRAQESLARSEVEAELEMNALEREVR